MTVLENVLLPLCADHRRAPWREGWVAAQRTLEYVGLDTLANAEARILSGGQAMLLQLARCLVQRPLRLCLLDEPFAGVHHTIKDRMVDVVLDINRLGGQRTLAGPVIGAVVVEIVSEALRAYGQIRMVLFALVVLGMMRSILWASSA
jgi:ABC-type branched-subunit amino acid transport system ATPase component